MPRPPSWISLAECRKRDADLWNTDLARSHNRADAKQTELNQRTAKSICMHICPVQRQCLEYALANWEMFPSGILGGLNQKERASLRLRRRGLRT